MLYQDFSKEALKNIFKNMITICLICIVEMAGLRFVGMGWPLAIFVSIGFFLALNYIYLRYIVENLYNDGPFKILLKAGDKIIDKNNLEWNVILVEKKEISIINSFNSKKTIHWKDLDNYKLK